MSKSTPYNKNNFSSYNISALLFSFLFLLVVLIINGLHQWQQEEKRFSTDVEKTVSNFANQSYLLAQASYRTNSLFARGNIDLIERAINNHTQSKQQLWNELQHAIFHLTGAAIFTGQGELKLFYGDQFSETEPQDIWQNIASLNDSRQVFAMRYDDKGGFYVFNPFYNSQDELFYLVVRRNYSELSRIVFNGGFNGYELILIDTRNESIQIGEGFLANVHSAPKAPQAIIARANITSTHWDIAATPKKTSILPIVWQYTWQPLLVLFAFLIVAALFVWRTRINLAQANELKQAEREAQQRASQLLNVIKDAYISTDTLGRVIYANPKATSLLSELGNDSPIGEILSMLWPDPAALWNQLHLINDYYQLEKLPLLFLNGTTQGIFEQAGTALYAGDEIIGHVWLLRDISEAELAQKEAQESNERYKTLFDEASVGHCLFDVNEYRKRNRLAVLRVNEAAVKMVQASSQQDLQENFFKLITSQSNSTFKYYLKRILILSVTSTEFELPIMTLKGEQRVFWVTLTITSNNNQQVLASFIDITEQKLNIQKNQEREVFWNKVMDAMPDVVYVVEIQNDTQANVIYHNRTMGSILGYSDPEEIGNSWLHYWIDNTDGVNTKQLTSAIKQIRQLSMGQTREASARFLHADGSTRIVKFRDTPMALDENGNVSRYIGTVRDVTEDIEKQELILESERRYRLLAENISDVIWAADINLNFSFVSSSVKHILGYKPDELLRSGIEETFRSRDIKIFVHQMKGMLAQSLQKSPTGNKKTTFSKDMIAFHKSGHELLLEIQAGPLYNDAGQLQGIVGTCRDVGEARQLQQELHLAAEVFDKSNEGIIITDRNTNIVKTNSAIHTITGYNEEELLGKKPAFLVSLHDHDKEFIKNIDNILQDQGYWQGEISYRKANGDVRTAWAGVSAVHDTSKISRSLIIILSDITERKRAEERIRQLAYYDSLTGLANRSQLNERLSLMLNKAKAHDQAVALLFIDLDRFKPINDTMGHPAGDAVLQEVAKRLKSCVKRNDFICRIGGDEFTLVIDAQPEEAVKTNAYNVATRILRILNQPYLIGKHEVFLSASIGVAIYPQDAVSVIDLLKRADMAMYHAKELGRNNVQFFDHNMSEQAIEKLILENDMRHALDRNQLELYYQPQYASDTLQPIAVEALLRWHHPERGLLSPSVFIPIIEDTGLIDPIGRWVLNEACMQFASWKAKGIQLDRIAINVSARQFKQADFVNIVLQAIEDSGIRTYELELEITETILIDDVEHTLNTLKALQRIGVRTAIDDFGTGYSSLNYLKQFPVDTLKIDRSFVQGLPDNDGDVQIAHTIIAMAHNLGMGVIAEGVESKEQLDFLVSANCEEVQGYLFSQPMNAEECRLHLIEESKNTDEGNS